MTDSDPTLARLAYADAARELSDRLAVQVSASFGPGAQEDPLTASSSGIATAARDLLAAAVIADRRNGASWAVVGEALGISRQSAQERFAAAEHAFAETVHRAGEPGGGAGGVAAGVDQRADRVRARVERWLAGRTGEGGGAGPAQVPVTALEPRETFERPEVPDLPPMLAAASRAFALYGVRRATLDDIAQEAGVSRSTVYRALGSKVAIQEQVAAARSAQTFARIRLAVPEGTPAAEALARIVVLAFEDVFANEVTMRLLQREPESLLPAFSEPADGGDSLYLQYGAILGGFLRERCPDADRMRITPEAAAELALRMQLSSLFAPRTRLPVPYDLTRTVMAGLVGFEDR